MSIIKLAFIFIILAVPFFILIYVIYFLIFINLFGFLYRHFKPANQLIVYLFKFRHFISFI